jgi:hypothetical protein
MATMDDILDKLVVDQKTINDLMQKLVEIKVLKMEGNAYRLTINIDVEDTARLFNHIYEFLDKSIGLQVAHDVMRITEKDFDDTKPITSLCTIITQMWEAFGKDMMENILNTSAKFELGEADKAKKLIEIERIATGKS